MNDSETKEEKKSQTSWFKSLIGKKSESSLRETIEEYIEEASVENAQIDIHEKSLISNILNLQDMVVTDVMIPRADIFSIDIDISQEELLKILSEKQYSRIPVHRGNLDDIVGSIHIKDILATLAKGEKVIIKKLIREMQIVSPAMPVLDLLLMIQQSKKHIAMVIDEYGGIDGLVTIGNIIESIIGEINDEHDKLTQPNIIKKSDGSYVADGRLDIEVFEKTLDVKISDEEREDVETVGGLLFFITGRIPGRGEIIKHKNLGLKFYILDADPRKVHKVRIVKK